MPLLFAYIVSIFLIKRLKQFYRKSALMQRDLNIYLLVQNSLLVKCQNDSIAPGALTREDIKACLKEFKAKIEIQIVIITKTHS